MRRGQIGMLLAVTSGLFSVLLAVAVNVATGGTLPGRLGSVSWLAWPAVGVLGLVGIGLAVWQQRIADAPSPPAHAVTAPPAHAVTAPPAYGLEQEPVHVAPEPAGAAPGVPERALTDPQRVVAEALRTVPAELPAAVELFGRDEVRDEVGRLAARPGAVVVLAAAPGAGKTALALRVAHDVRSRYADGQLHAALLGGSAEPARPEAVLGRFLAALGAPAEQRRGGADELAARFRSAVADRAVLVVLDDARNAAQVAPLLPGGARCATIVTSRSPLAELPGARLVGLGALDDDAGLELLADAAGAGRVAADPDGARALVAACGGLPLAVRIVGGRLRARAGWTPSQLAARLAGERGRLDELRQGDLAVRATFRAAYDGLPEADRLVFRRAGSHPAQSFGPAAAAARAGLPPAEATAALERLADAYLVDAGEGADTAARLMRHLAALPGPAAADLAGLPAVLREGLDAGLREDVIALVDAAGPRQEDPFDRLAAWRAQAEATAGESGRRRARALRWVSRSPPCCASSARSGSPRARPRPGPGSASSRSAAATSTRRRRRSARPRTSSAASATRSGPRRGAGTGRRCWGARLRRGRTRTRRSRGPPAGCTARGTPRRPPSARGGRPPR
ncbi:MAG TPA: NB-ARC domain-containing protein [Dactylosporangium sp.]|nr:NB-ARC domain-containing protein [Dactylosporangium sp.]